MLQPGHISVELLHVGRCIFTSKGCSPVVYVKKEQEDGKQRLNRQESGINFSVSAKGVFQPDITSEAETVATAMANLDEANTQLNNWALTKGIIRRR